MSELFLTVLKGWIKNILNYKKAVARVMVVSIIFVAALVLGFASNRPTADGSAFNAVLTKQEKESESLSNTPISKKVNIIIMLTDHDPRYSYYYQPEDQLKFSGMIDAIQRTPLNKFPADTYHLNICIAKDGVSWEMLSNGAFYYQDDDGSFLGENKDLYDEVLQRNREDLSKP